MTSSCDNVDSLFQGSKIRLEFCIDCKCSAPLSHECRDARQCLAMGPGGTRPGKRHISNRAEYVALADTIPVKLPWIFPGAPLTSMGLPEISRVT